MMMFAFLIAAQTATVPLAWWALKGHSIWGRLCICSALVLMAKRRWTAMMSSQIDSNLTLLDQVDRLLTPTSITLLLLIGLVLAVRDDE